MANATTTDLHSGDLVDLRPSALAALALDPKAENNLKAYVSRVVKNGRVAVRTANGDNIKLDRKDMRPHETSMQRETRRVNDLEAAASACREELSAWTATIEKAVADRRERLEQVAEGVESITEWVRWHAEDAVRDEAILAHADRFGLLTVVERALRGDLALVDAGRKFEEIETLMTKQLIESPYRHSSSSHASTLTEAIGVEALAKLLQSYGVRATPRSIMQWHFSTADTIAKAW